MTLVLGDLLCLFLRFQHYPDCNMDKKMLKNSDSETFNSMNDQLGNYTLFFFSKCKPYTVNPNVVINKEIKLT